VFPVLEDSRCSVQDRGNEMTIVSRAAFLFALSFCALLVLDPVNAAKANDIIKLSNNQRIACSRGLSAGKLQNINCKSYAYIFNSQTSEFYRCQVSVAVTRDNKEVLKIDTGGDCVLKTRVFPEDSNYSFDATETEPPNTNSFFGSGGTAIWVSDNTKLKAKGCIQLAVGVAPDVLKCVDMTFEK
jgi:hypothetical protein